MKLQLFIDKKRKELIKMKKLMKRKAFFLKVKIFLTCVLPVIIILLMVKIIQTLVRTEIRKAASGIGQKGLADSKRAVVQTAKKPEFVTPVPVGTTAADD